nr:uncharacterized protein CTRU02_14186 [Colletotrichum truncatum]KAF6782539.1 hypothetical protein CTRU02_14186 [Colletotrichum truncatum]
MGSPPVWTTPALKRNPRRITPPNALHISK